MNSLLPLARLTCVAAVVALTTAGCDLRIDTHDSPFERLTVADTARYQAAVCEQQVSAALRAARPNDEEAANVLKEIDAGARRRLDAFGQPWSVPSVDRTEVPSAPPAPPAPKNPVEAMTRLATCARQAGVDAAAVGESELAKLLVAAAAARSTDVRAGAKALGIAVPAAGEVSPSSPLVLDSTTHTYRPPNAEETKRFTTEETKPPKTPDADEGTALGESVVEIDYARYRLEQAASRLPISAKKLAIATAEQLSYEVEVLIDSGAPDTRRPGYGRIDLSDPAQRALEATTDALAAQYRLVQASTRAPIRQRAVLAATTAWATARAWGQPADALAGLRVTAPATVLPGKSDGDDR